MSLDWNLDNIENVEEVCYEGDHLAPVTNALIWATMAVGIGVIDDGTVDEFVARVAFWEKNVGPFLTQYDEETDQYGPWSIPAERIRQHKGLRTNVFPHEPRDVWLWRVTRIVEPFDGVRDPAMRCSRSHKDHSGDITAIEWRDESEGTRSLVCQAHQW